MDNELLYHINLTKMSLMMMIIIIIIIIFHIKHCVVAVVIAVSSAVRRVITNDQRLIEFALSYISSTFLKILAVPNKAAFCITPTLHVIPNLSIHLSNSLVIHPRAPITIGTT